MPAKTISSPKQKFLAEQLKLSPTTVSRSLRNHPSIKPETRARVHSMAERLGYRVPPAWRVGQRASGQAAFITALIRRPFAADRQDWIATKFLAGLGGPTARQDVSVLVHHFDVERDGLDLLEHGNQPQPMRDGSVLGLVLIHRFNPEGARQLAAQFPVVSLVWDIPGARADHIDVNAAQAILSLVAHLQSLGHRRIGFVGRGPGFAYGFTRYGAYTQAMARLGLDVDPQAIGHVTWALPTWDARADWVLQATRSRNITAWVCVNDDFANQLIPRLRLRGLRIPDDISVTGFDGGEAPPGLSALTTIRVPFVDMGATAAMKLLERIENPTLSPRSILLGGEFVLGETTGPAAT